MPSVARGYTVLQSGAGGVKKIMQRLLRLNLVVCALAAVTTLAGCGVAQTAVQPASSSTGYAQ
jgi:hypothetical protein